MQSFCVLNIPTIKKKSKNMCVDYILCLHGRDASKQGLV